jgi:ABC-type transporter Mla maintaining outer membrane lipid asymmetry permease subunit MlaE
MITGMRFGVGRATTACVVRAFVTIFICNYFITGLWL